MAKRRRTEDTMAKRRRTDNTMAKRRRTDNTMTKRRRTDNTMAKRRRTDNTMAKRRRTKGQTTIYKTLHIKLKQNYTHDSLMCLFVDSVCVNSCRCLKYMYLFFNFKKKIHIFYTSTEINTYTVDEQTHHRIVCLVLF
jgi:hypothetical protein